MFFSKTKAHITLLLLCLSLFGYAQAAINETVSRSFDVRDNPTLEIHNISGSVTLKSGNPGMIVAHVTRHNKNVTINFSSSEKKVALGIELVKMMGIDPGESHVEMIFEVPPSTNVRINTISAMIDASGIGSDFSIKTISGDIKLQNISGALEASSVSGHIQILNSKMTEVSCRTVSGNITYSDIGKDLKKSRFSSTSGDIQMNFSQQTPGDIQLSSIAGQLGIEFPQNKLRAEKARGRQQLQLHSSNGNMSVAGETISGDISVVFSNPISL